MGNQCAPLRAVEKGAKKAHYTKGDAQYHWGVSPADQWVLFDVKNDPGCRKDLSAAHPERIQSMVTAYDRWWDAMLPEMVERGGETPLKQVLEQKASRAADRK